VIAGLFNDAGQQALNSLDPLARFAGQNYRDFVLKLSGDYYLSPAFIIWRQALILTDSCLPFNLSRYIISAMKTETKLNIALFSVFFVTLITISLIGIYFTSNLLVQETINHLQGIADIQKNQIEHELDKHSDDLFSYIIKDYSGLGKTGEIILAKRDANGDAVFIAPTRLDPQAANKVRIPKNDTQIAITHALQKKERTFSDYLDYRGKPVLGVTRYIAKVDWGLVVKMDRDEVCAPAYALFGSMFIVILIFSAIVILILPYFSRLVTAQLRRSEDALLESEDIFSQFMKRSPVYVFFKDENIRAIRLSANYEKMLGRPLNELLGKNMEDLFPSDLSKSMVADDMRVLKEGKPIEIEEELNGRFYSTIKFPIHREGKPDYLAGFTVDITERKQAEEKIREAEKKFRVVFDSAGDGILLADPEKKKFLMGNQAICRMLGYSPEEIKNLGVMDIHPEKDIPYVIDQFERQAKGEFSLTRDLPVKRKDGSVFYADVNAAAVTLAGKAYLTGFFHETTERKKMEEKLRDLFENSNDIITYVDTHGKMVDVNRRITDILGYLPEELVGKKFVDLGILQLKDVPQIVKLFTETIFTGEPKTIIELELKHKNGSKVFMEVGTRFIKTDGQIKGVVNSFRDVTERKQDEEKLLLKTTLLEAQSEASIDGILAIDDNGKSILFNKRFGEMWKIPREILDAKNDEKMLQHVMGQLKDPDEFINKVKYLYAHRDEKSRDEIEFKDGRFFDRYSSPLTGANGKYYGRIWYFRDITERKQAEEIIFTEKERLLVSLHSIGDGLIATDNKGKVMILNKVGEELTGWSEAEALGKNASEVFKIVNEETRLPCADPIAKVLKLGEITGLANHTMLISQDGREIPIADSAAPIHDRQGNVIGVILVFRDITDTRRVERMQNEFVSTVSHELRTPLSIIKEGISLTVEGLYGKIEEDQKKSLTIVLRNVDRLARIINSILDISRLEGGKVELKKELFNIADLGREVVSNFSPSAKDKGLELRGNIPSEKVMLSADRDKLMEIFVNLVGNALKFTEKGYIEVSMLDKADRIECSVADSGRGISQTDLPKAFSKFEQFGRGTGPGEKGTGLGLYIVKKLVELHKGKVWVESEPGKGTKFTFTLPKGE